MYISEDPLQTYRLKKNRVLFFFCNGWHKVLLIFNIIFWQYTHTHTRVLSMFSPKAIKRLPNLKKIFSFTSYEIQYSFNICPALQPSPNNKLYIQITM